MSLINENTKIGFLIKENPQSIEAIARINTHFKKLQNPVLRKFLANRVTIKDAAKIGGVSLDEFMGKLKEIGFLVESTVSEPVEKEKTPGFTIDYEHLVSLDVRPVINAGGDPFNQIMEAIKKLQPHETLEVINVFEPIPLIDLLKKQQFEHQTLLKSAGEYHTYFKKTDTSITTDKNLAEELNKMESIELKMIDFGSNLTQIDVRELEMPQPMVTILNTLSTLPEHHALFVHHKKVPQFLLPELKSRNFQWVTKEVSENYVQMLIWK